MLYFLTPNDQTEENTMQLAHTNTTTNITPAEAVLQKLLALQIGKPQTCGVCGREYQVTQGEKYRPAAICVECWGDVSEVERYVSDMEEPMDLEDRLAVLLQRPVSIDHVIDVDDLTLEQAQELGAEWLEDSGDRFSRFWIGGEQSAWVCHDCGHFGVNPDDGICPHCDDADEWESDDEDN